MMPAGLLGLIVAVSFFASVAPAQTCGRERPRPEAIRGGIIVGNGYPTDTRTQFPLESLPDSEELHQVIERVAARSPVLEKFLRTQLNAVERTIKFTAGLSRNFGSMLRAQGIALDGEGRVRTTARLAPELGPECFMRATSRGAPSSDGNGLKIGNFSVEFSPWYFNLPLQSDSAEEPSRLRVLMQLLVFVSFSGGTSGQEQEFTETLLQVAANVTPLARDRELLLERSLQAISAPESEKDTPTPAAQNSERRSRGEFRHTETSACRAPARFTRYDPSAALIAEIGHFSNATLQFPKALVRVAHFLDMVVRGHVPIYATPTPSTKHVAKLVWDHFSGTEIVAYPAFFSLPVTDDRPGQPSQLKVVLHEAAHFASQDKNEDFLDDMLSEEEHQAIASAEIMYRLVRGLSIDYLGFEIIPKLWGARSRGQRPEWNRAVCRQIERAEGIGVKESVLAMLARDREESWREREVNFKYFAANCREFPDGSW